MKSRLVGLVAALTLAVAGGAVGFTQLAFAGTPGPAAPLTIVKVVDGPVPAGTTFEVSVHCDDTIIDDGATGTADASVTFDENGQPTSPDVIGFDGPGTCRVTETATGGAASVEYACEGVQGTPMQPAPAPEGAPSGTSFGDPSSTAEVLPPVCGTTGPVDPIEVNISAPDQSGTVTVTNTFPEPQPQPAAEVVAAPAFTG